MKDRKFSKLVTKFNIGLISSKILKKKVSEEALVIKELIRNVKYRKLKENKLFMEKFITIVESLPQLSLPKWQKTNISDF